MKLFDKQFFIEKKNGLIVLIIISIILTILLILKTDGAFFQNALTRMCINTRSVVTIFCYCCFAFLLFIVLSKYGNIRLGGPKAKKEYNTFSWLSCLFMAGCGIGIVFYCQEPILHLHSNPYLGRVVGEPTTIAYSLTLFNWTINAWIQYGVLGVIISYFFFNKRKDLKLSSILPNNTFSYVKSSIDILMALGVIAGLTTSLGLGVSQISKGFQYVFKINISPYFLMIIIEGIATWSVSSGLKKGVKWLSNISSALVSILLVSILCIGLFSLNLTGFLKYIGKGTGLLFRNFFQYNDFWNHNDDIWAAHYPIFFDLWFASWSAFVSVFAAKISKGRTLREFILGVVGIPTLFTIIWFGIFGRVGIEFKDIIYETMSAEIPTALFIFLQNISGEIGYILLSVLVLIIICMFFITSSDSGSFVVSTLLSRGETGYRDKIFWASVQCIVAMVLFYCGGLALVQSISVIMGIIVMALVVLGSIFFVYILIKDNKQIT